MGPVVPRRARMLVRKRTNPKNILQYVYRYGTHTLEDWASTMKSVFGSRGTRGDAMSTFPPCGTLASRIQEPRRHVRPYLQPSFNRRRLSCIG